MPLNQAVAVYCKEEEQYVHWYSWSTGGTLKSSIWDDWYLYFKSSNDAYHFIGLHRNNWILSGPAFHKLQQASVYKSFCSQPSIPGKYVLIRPTCPSEVGSNLISSIATDPPVSQREAGSVPGEVEKSWYTRTVETNTIPKEGPSSPVSRSLASQTLNFPPMDSSEDDPMQVCFVPRLILTVWIK